MASHQTTQDLLNIASNWGWPTSMEFWVNIKTQHIEMYVGGHLIESFPYYLLEDYPKVFLERVSEIRQLLE
jgi:hypothetical protein